MSHVDWLKATKGLATKSAKIRALDALGVPRADIARFLDIRYQHVRNVLTQDRPVRGVAEAPAGFEREETKACILDDGSVRVPASLAGQLGGSPGETLVVVPKDGGLWIATRKAGRRHAQDIVSRYVPDGVSLVDELLADRRREVEREEGPNAG